MNVPRFLKAIALVGVVVLSWSATAYGDNVIADGDLVDTDVENSSLEFGEVCATTGTDGFNGGNHRTVALYVQKAGNASTRFADNTDVAFSVVAPTHADLGATFASPGKLTTTPTWGADGTIVGPLNASVKLTRPTVGNFTGSGTEMTFRGTGAAAGGGILTPSRTINVVGHVVSDGHSTNPATTVDCKLPTAAITNPVTPQPSYDQNSPQTAAFTCADPTSTAPAPTSGVKSCSGVVTGPAPASTTVATLSSATTMALPTGTLGVFTLTVTPVDHADNVGQAVSRTYEVVEPSSNAVVTFEGFFSPVEAVNKVKAGQAVPLKWRTYADSTLVENDTAGHTIESRRVPLTYCGEALNGSTDSFEDVTLTGNKTQVQWDGDVPQYIGTWKTDKAWNGHCREVKVTYDDGDGGVGSLAEFYFYFTK